MNLITSKISIDLMKPSEPPVVHAVQGECNVRSVQMSIFCDGAPWQIPENAFLGVRYGRVTQTGGYYDTLPDGACAWKYQGNIITIALAPQMMTSAGSVFAQVEIRQEDQVLATFSFRLLVEGNPAIGISEPETYVNWLQWLEKELDDYIDKVNKSGELLGGTMVGPINMNGQPITGLNAPTANDQAANMGFVNQQVKKAAPRNLLDNSDFRNPVNQRGQTVYAEHGYALDRWILGSASEGSCVINADSITINNGWIYQFIENLDTTKQYTLVWGDDGGYISVKNHPIRTDISSYPAVVIDDSFGRNLRWAALYEGEYTAETLPEYQSRGYGAELTECRRYYREDPVTEINHSGQVGMVLLNTPFYDPPMRVTPTFAIKDFTAGMGDLPDSSAINNSWGGDNRRTLLHYNSTGVASQCMFTFVSSADL